MIPYKYENVSNFRKTKYRTCSSSRARLLFASVWLRTDLIPATSGSNQSDHPSTHQSSIDSRLKWTCVLSAIIRVIPKFYILWPIYRVTNIGYLAYIHKNIHISAKYSRQLNRKYKQIIVCNKIPKQSAIALRHPTLSYPKERLFCDWIRHTVVSKWVNWLDPRIR